MAKHFEKYAHSTAETAAILILDGHCSCKELQTIPLAHNDHRPMLSMPAHTTHKLHGACTATYVSLRHYEVLTALHITFIL
jgi:hypothetical protein